jgi:hypothetical protein
VVRSYVHVVQANIKLWIGLCHLRYVIAAAELGNFRRRRTRYREVHFAKPIASLRGDGALAAAHAGYGALAAAHAGYGDPPKETGGYDHAGRVLLQLRLEFDDS